MSEATQSRPVLTLAGATVILQAGLAKATEMGIPQAIVVVDTGGHQIASARQDGAPLIGLSFAQKKAQSSALISAPTQALWDMCKDDPTMVTGIAGDDELMVLGGGVPVTVDGVIVGAVGASGGHYVDDTTVAESAAAALS